MNRYCLVLSEDRYKAFTIKARTWDEALSIAYESYRYRSKLSTGDYKSLLSNKVSEEGIKLFEDLLDMKVVFFGVVKGTFKDELYELK